MLVELREEKQNTAILNLKNEVGGFEKKIKKSQ